MSDLVDYMRAVDEERCNVEPWTVAQRCADAAAEITKLRAALREIVAMDEVAIVEWKKGDGWLHQRVARAALKEDGE